MNRSAARPEHPCRPPRAIHRGTFLAGLLGGALLAGPDPAGATITPEGAAVLRRYLEATGGAAAFAAESTAYAHARVDAFGFTGSFSAWTARPLRRYAVTELGPFKLREGVDGATAWRTDPTTGVVRAVSDHDLDQALAGAWFELERWAEPDQGGGVVTGPTPARDSLDRYLVLEITPPDLAGGGRKLPPRRFWFRETTGLLARIDGRSDQREVTTTLHDWRPGGLRRRAWVNETGVADMPANRLRATFDTLLSNVSVAGLPFAAPLEGGSPVRWLAGRSPARLPFEYRARHIWLKAGVNGGPPEDFLFDTGASVTVVDSAWAAERGLKTEGRMQAAGAGAAGGASFATLGSLRVASAAGDGVELPGVQVAVLDVNTAFAPLFWRRMAGVIGYDVISRFVVQLDYDDSLLVLHDPAGWSYAGPETPLPMVMNGTVPALTGKLDGQDEGLFRLDVGSSSTVDLHAPFAREKRVLGRLGRTQRVDGVGFGGSFTSEIGRLRRMSLGPYEWDDPIVSVAHATEGAFASEEFAGNIGNRILERFRVTLDYRRRQVILEPGRRYGERDHLTRCGVLLARRDGRVNVVSVLDASPADRGGLRAGDEVLAVDGRPIADWDLPGISALLDDGESGRRVGFRVLRDGHERELRVRLAEVVR
jgi:hypothetical protein